MLKFSELETYRGSFLEKYLNIDNPFRINYQHINVPTGRMSSGTSKGNTFFAPANIQNVPKTEMIRYLHVGSELGYYVDESPIDAIDKIKVKGGLRDAFIPPEGFVWLCADYQAEEMRVMANLSGEQNLINPILSGEDIHKHVGTKMFGSYDPSHRTVAKTINFAANYGAGGYTIAQKLGVSEEQGTEYLAKYNASLPQLTRWKQEMMNEGRRKGVVFTYMGRPRAVWQYYQSSDYKMHAYADRTCVNTVVQGLGGDLIRLDHIKIMTKFLQDPEFAENVKYSMTVHDEISLFVRPAYLKRAFHFLKELMYYKPSNFPVPIIAEPAVGTSWSNLIDCDDVTEDGKLIINKYEGKDVSELIAKFREENKELYE